MLIGHQRCVLTPNLHELSLIENYLSDVVDVPNIEVKREQFITYEIGHCEDVMCLKETEREIDVDRLISILINGFC